MKLNLTIKAIKNYQTVELTAENMDFGNFYNDRDWMVSQAVETLNKLVPEDGEIVTTTNTNYKAATQLKGASASQKQVNFLRALGYTEDVSNMSVTEANYLIKQLKASKSST